MQTTPRDTPHSAFRSRWLVPRVEPMKYSFVLHHQHGRHANQEYKYM